MLCFCLLKYTLHSLSVGKGVPNRLASLNNHANIVPPSQLPSPEDAVQHFENMGGSLTIESSFGEDVLAGRPDLVAQRESTYFQQASEFSTIFHSLVNGNDLPFRQSLKLLLQLTEQLES